MGISDSDSENEEFESAEESLDEEETEKYSVKASESSSSQFSNEFRKNIASSLDIKVSEKSVSNNLSYRKRPERVKQTSSITNTKSVAKSPSNELIFKTDKVSPDVFFQDITSNINKSFNTLQQTSSNVKDLILSSLPVSSNEIRDGFIYDERTIAVDDDANMDMVSQNKQIPKESKNVFTENLIATSIGLENKATEAIFSVLDKLTGIKKEEQLPDIKNHEIEKKVVDFTSGNKSSALEELQHLETIDDAISDSENCKNKIDQMYSDVKSNKKKKTVEDEDNLDFSKSDNKFSEPSHKDLKNEGTQEIESAILNKSFSENKEVHEDLNKSALKKNKFYENLDKENFLTPSILKDQISNNDAEFEKGKEVYNAEINDIDLKCNLEILEHSDDAKEQETNIVSENNILENQCELDIKEKCDLEKEISINLINEMSNLSNDTKQEDMNTRENLDIERDISNDGWDDFDFSDNDLENEVDNQNNNKISAEDGKTKCDIQALEAKLETVKSKNSDHKNFLNMDSKNFINSTSDEPKEEGDKINKVNNKENVEKHNKMEGKIKDTKHVPENLSTTEDNWDWGAWEENYEAENKNVNKNMEEESISKWHGWDTFGQKQQEKQGNWGLGSWGVDVLLNKASAVTQGISNALEAGLGAPDPVTLARMEKIEREKLKEVKQEETVGEEAISDATKKNSLTSVNIFPVSGITNLVAGVTSKIVEHSKIQEIGTKVIIGGLDTLESFGKKTMEVLQEGDPGLKNKRSLLLGKDKPVLSQVLKEAREKADKELRAAEEKEIAKKCHFETLFDDYQGMVHLEALEMLSTQCELKLDQLRSGMNAEEQEDLNGILEEVEQLCALDECEINLHSSVLDFKALIEKAVEPLKNEISVYNIIQIHNNVDKWLENSLSDMAIPFSVLNQKFVSTVAELAAATVQQFHKSGELLSVKECRKTVEEVDALSRLTNILCSEINKICDKFISLSQKNCPENKQLIIEKVSVVKKNSTSYIRQAFSLLIPVLQLGAAV